MAEQYIFTIEGLTKAYNKREVLKNIWLAFYPGAKIGVIGTNGAGKSTLLRIMAGVDKDFIGTARLTPGFTVGYVPQEPRLDDDKDVRGNVEEAVAATRALLHKHEEIGNKIGRAASPTRWTSSARRDRQGPGQDRRRQRLGTRPPARNRHGRDAAAARRRRPSRRCPAASGAASPCARCCCRSPTCLLLDEPTNHLDAESVAWLERHLAGVSRHRRLR